MVTFNVGTLKKGLVGHWSLARVVNGDFTVSTGWSIDAILAKYEEVKPKEEE
jgi:hypothetical protein